MRQYGYPSDIMGFGLHDFSILGWFFVIILWILLILGVVALFRYVFRTEKDDDEITPIDIIKERYARGEINRKEFEEKKKDLA